jgi:hypothetical protein
MIDFQSVFAQTGMGSATVPVAAFGVPPNASLLCASVPLLATFHVVQKSVFISLPAEALAKAGVHPLATFHVVVKFPVLAPNIQACAGLCQLLPACAGVSPREGGG